MDGPGGHYAKLNKSDRKRQILYDCTYMCVTKSKLPLLAPRQGNESGDEVLRQGIRLYSEIRQTEKIVD